MLDWTENPHPHWPFLDRFNILDHHSHWDPSSLERAGVALAGCFFNARQIIGRSLLQQADTQAATTVGLAQKPLWRSFTVTQRSENVQTCNESFNSISVRKHLVCTPTSACQQPTGALRPHVCPLAALLQNCIVNASACCQLVSSATCLPSTSSFRMPAEEKHNASWT